MQKKIKEKSERWKEVKSIQDILEESNNLRSLKYPAQSPICTGQTGEPSLHPPHPISAEEVLQAIPDTDCGCLFVLSPSAATQLYLRVQDLITQSIK